MKTNILYIALFSVTLFSCKEELQPQESSKAVRAEQSNAQNTVQNQQQTVATQTAQATQVAQTQTTTQAGKNPAHGQPGHRCDLPVGASLTGTAPAQQQTQTAQQIKVTPQMIANNMKTQKGVNPPHGQPGHVCGTPSTTAKPQTGAATISTTPAIIAPNAASNTTSIPANNPPHGQPGHVCGTPAATTTTTTEVPATIAPVKMEGN